MAMRFNLSSSTSTARSGGCPPRRSARGRRCTGGRHTPRRSPARAVRLQVYRGKIFAQAVAEAVVSAKHLFAHLVVVPDNLPPAPARHQHRQRKVAQGLVAVGRKLLFHRLVELIDALAQRSQLPGPQSASGPAARSSLQTARRSAPAPPA